MCVYVCVCVCVCVCVVKQCLRSRDTHLQISFELIDYIILTWLLLNFYEIAEDNIWFTA